MTCLPPVPEKADLSAKYTESGSTEGTGGTGCPKEGTRPRQDSSCLLSQPKDSLPAKRPSDSLYASDTTSYLPQDLASPTYKENVLVKVEQLLWQVSQEISSRARRLLASTPRTSHGVVNKRTALVLTDTGLTDWLVSLWPSRRKENFLSSQSILFIWKEIHRTGREN